VERFEYNVEGLTQNGKLAQLIEERKIWGLPSVTYGQARRYEPTEILLPDGPYVEVRSHRITLSHRRGVDWPVIEYFDSLWQALDWVNTKQSEKWNKDYNLGYCIVGHGKCYAMLKPLEVWESKW
jgi:hypothetical protein